MLFLKLEPRLKLGDTRLLIAILVIGPIAIIAGSLSFVAIYAMNRPADARPHARAIFREFCSVFHGLWSTVKELSSVVKAVIDLLIRRRR